MPNQFVRGGPGDRVSAGSVRPGAAAPGGGAGPRDFPGDAGRRGSGPGGGTGGRTDRRPGGRAVGIKNPRGLSAPGAVDRGSTMRTNVLYHGNVCLTRGNLHDHK